MITEMGQQSFQPWRIIRWFKENLEEMGMIELHTYKRFLFHLKRQKLLCQLLVYTLYKFFLYKGYQIYGWLIL